ncbi:MAG: hypothetical protein CVU90_08825 [Firmicutes bacterium HGW-Firmicutes-15]|nr:MAG: hypothetical protein CVU90_08825 [Firmicutes bacterium HGW-Firmicutes-15]
MKIGVCTAPIAPIHSAAFSPRSYNPKAKVPISITKPAAKQSQFFMVLSALLTADSSHLPTKK